jgi:hypothetical protein
LEEIILGVLFGTVEYFEQEITNYLSNDYYKGEQEESFSTIASKLEHEILYDFPCHERLRKECLENLIRACNKVNNEKRLLGNELAGIPT